MKTRRSSLALGAAALALSAASLIAGPGPQYWQSLRKPAAPAVEPAKTPAIATPLPVCPGSKIVPVTVMKPSWPNGRGPLAPVPVGTERVCHRCITTTVVTTNDWPSHRGPPVQKVDVTKAGAPHVCTTACPPPPKA